jgi:MFS family permease
MTRDAASPRETIDLDERSPRLLVEVVLVCGIALLGAVIFTWPLLLHFQTRMHDVVDPPFQAWTIDWVQHALSAAPRHMYDANIFAPNHTTLAYSDTLFGVAIPFTPLRWLGVTPVGQVNLAILLGLAATAAAGYALGRVVTGSVIVGAVTGAACTFAPSATELMLHVHVAMRPAIPLAALLVWVIADRVEHGRAVLGPALALGAVLVWQATVSFYPVSYAIVVTVVVALVRLRSLRWRGVRAVALGLVATFATMGLLALPYVEVRRRFTTFTNPLSAFNPLGSDFTRADPGSWVWGHALGGGHTWPAFPGVVLSVLAIVGIVGGLRAGGRTRTVAICGIALLVVGAILAIGTADHGWRAYAPYRLLYEAGVWWRALRATARAWTIGLVGLGLLAGLGARSTARAVGTRAPRLGRLAPAVVTAVLIVAFVVEAYVPVSQFPRVVPRPVDRALARLHEPGGVVYLPAGPAFLLGEAVVTYRTTAHHRRTINGYSGFIPPSYARLTGIARSLPDPGAIATLERAGMRYVVVSRPLATGPWSRLATPATARPLRLLGDYDGDLLYVLP